MENFGFEIVKKMTGAALGRAGVIKTRHGKVNTPAFVPVATKATVKAILPEQIENLGGQIILANAYHLYLQPGEKIVNDAGGLGRFMNWNRPTMTDSGGFQVFSLGAAYGSDISKIAPNSDTEVLIPVMVDENNPPRLARIDSDGVYFSSHLDGSLHYLTPEKSIKIQHRIGADIIFAFDECTSPSDKEDYQREALERTHRWARKSLEFHKSTQGSKQQALFGIVQGGRNESLRKESAKIISEMGLGLDTIEGFDGFGIGGSFAKEDISTVVRWVNEILPQEKPRHLLGIGEPEDLFVGVENGVDLFDCVAPTRNARGGTLYTRAGKINITNAKYTTDTSPIEDDCQCYTCTSYTKAYLSHLLRAKEMIAATLASIHNLHFIVNLVSEMRNAILTENFLEYKNSFLRKYKNLK